MLRADKVYKLYGSERILHDINLELRAGEILGLVEENMQGVSLNPCPSITLPRESIWQNILKMFFIQSEENYKKYPPRGLVAAQLLMIIY